MSKLLDNLVKKASAYLNNHLKKTSWFLKISSEKVVRFPMPKRGNKVYAYFMQEKLDALVKTLTRRPARFITLTLPYDYEAPEESWRTFRILLPKFFRRAKFDAYLYVYEAHEKGGCHVHAIVNGGPDLRELKRIWPGHIKVKVVKSAEVGAYLTKELGKAGHVETAIKRVVAGTATPSDVKKILRLYFLTKLKMRGWGASRNLKLEEPDPEEAFNDLIKSNTNSTDKIIEIPREIVLDPRFLPFTGRLEPGTDQWLLLEPLISQVRVLMTVSFSDP